MSDRPSHPATDPTIAPAAPTAAPDALSGTLASGGGAVAPGGPGVLRPGIVVAETYEIIRLLGQGGMGAVWEAKHLRLPPWVLTGDNFFEPRFFAKTKSSNFRGLDMRLFASVDVDADKETCSVSCGDRKTDLQIPDASPRPTPFSGPAKQPRRPKCAGVWCCPSRG